MGFLFLHRYRNHYLTPRSKSISSPAIEIHVFSRQLFVSSNQSEKKLFPVLSFERGIRSMSQFESWSTVEDSKTDRHLDSNSGRKFSKEKHVGDARRSFRNFDPGVERFLNCSLLIRVQAGWLTKFLFQRTAFRIWAGMSIRFPF
jgi:hypothetical protein